MMKCFELIDGQLLWIRRDQVKYIQTSARDNQFLFYDLQGNLYPSKVSSTIKEIDEFWGCEPMPAEPIR